MSDKSDDELRGLFQEIGELKEVPLGVASSMEKTIQGLLQEGKIVKTSWITRNSLALAAGFIAVFALGIALNMDSSPVKNISPTNTDTQNPQNNNDVLTSLGSEIEVSDAPLQQFNSGLDYAKPIVIKDLPFTPISTYSTADTLSDQLGNCLVELGLSETVSFIDNALYNKKGATAVWSAIDLNSWQISILNQKCEPLDEIFVRK
jgi:hypothetical protein